MSLNRISAAEAASLIKHGYNIGLSGFTPAGTAKAVTAELAKIAEAEHAKGNPFQVGIFTGASTGESCDGVLSRAKAIRYRAPYTTNSDFRKAVNNGEIAYNDIHLSQMAQEVRYGFMGKVNVAIIEACEVTPDGKIYLTAAGGIAPTICRLADQIIVELNSAHSKSGMGMHDVYEPLDPPYRREIPIYKPSDRIGLPYVQVDPKKIIGVVETNWPDEARSFAAADPLTDKIGQNVADNSKGVAKGITMAGYAAGAGMGVWGTIDMYKATKNQGQSTYAGGLTKVIIGALALGLGELLGSGSATLFGSDQTSGMGELGL